MQRDIDLLDCLTRIIKMSEEQNASALNLMTLSLKSTELVSPYSDMAKLSANTFEAASSCFNSSSELYSKSLKLYYRYLASIEKEEGKNV